ncbi:uncharacterized protein ccdc142 isoform X2 [Pangasianodon hypophthalmus]|uniref:uncharacterized protein ccdc142 isoform X2 n=1 Tax=Pangasianodon hypophthalmus TaxID=310915 RepID=UPI002307D398|nr:uncharacterized protein ccdc142 isoform X2 [Pangasianodon hypophthalmus]
MAQASSSPQEGHSEAEPCNKTQTHPHTADRGLPSAVTDSSELQASDTDQVTLRKPNSCPEILPEKYRSKDKQDGSQYQGPFTKSRQKTDPLFQKRFSPNLKHLLRQKSDSSTWNYENEDNFVACQDLTSRSSQRLQHLEHTLLSLKSQCHVLRGSGGCLKGCIKGLSPSAEEEFYHHPQAAAFSQHYAQLQHLLEQRAQLLFLHEYGRRCRAANCFISRLGDVLEKAHLLASRAQSSKEQANSSWNLDLRAMCEELQVHISHWDMLYARARSDPFLRTVFSSRTEMLGLMQRKLWLLAQQALLLMENCMHTLLKALGAAQLVCVPRDALEDMLSAVEIYNHVVANPRSQKRAAAWSLQILFNSDCSQTKPDLARKHVRPGTLLVVEIMRIVARHRAQIAARQLYSWTCQQTDLLSLAGQTSMKWGDLDCPDLLVAPTSDQSSSILDKSPKKPLQSSSLPLFVFAHWDREDILETLFQVLVSSTDLLAPHIPKRPPKRHQLDRSASAERSRRASGQEENNNPKMYPSHIQNTVQRIDLSNTDACVALFSQYRDMLWREFGKAVIKHFYYPSHNSILGGMYQWNDQMVLLLVRWLKQACKEEWVPAECKDVLNKFCSHILSAAAYMHWDAIMCESLGLGMKDKCSPRTTTEPSTVRTATMELTLQLFPPLLSVLQLLQTPHTNLGEKGTLGLYHLGLLCRAQATVQSSTFWVMSKAYQFLASWSLTKFVLVTQGDLKALREAVESLVQELNAVVGSTDHHHHHHHHLIMEHGLQLSDAVSQLQAFSELVLRIFSMDCKKMSMEIFEQTMPSAKHWRVNYKTELPSTPSDYAAFAAQSVLGQVLEGMQPLPDETRIPALAEAMTAFMEAWMEHILKQKIKFSVHGALQLKQDFDLIRELIRSEKYSLSEELHHRLLSLRVFHQVDSAIVCLLQQPVTKAYMPSLRWEPFRHCCPNRAQVVDQAVGSLNSLETIDIQAACHQALTRAEGSVSPELLSTAPPESYLAVAQQEWLDLRIHTSSRWRIPGLRCLTKSEP